MTVESTEVAEDTVGLLSTLLSRREETIEEFSVLVAFDNAFSVEGLAVVKDPPSPFTKVGGWVSVIVAVLPSSTCSDEPPTGNDWNDRAALRSRTLLTRFWSSCAIASSSSELLASKKWITPLPDFMANACAVRAISCASRSVSDCRNVNPDWRTDVISEKSG